MVARKFNAKRAASPTAKGRAAATFTPTSEYPTSAKRPARVADVSETVAYRAVALPEHYGEVAEERGSGVMRRKNLNVDQGLLDHARHVLGKWLSWDSGQ